MNTPSYAAGGPQPSASPYPGAAYPGAPYGANGSFSAGSLVNSDALPEWLVQSGAGGSAGSGALRSNAGYGPGAAPSPGYGQPSWQAGYGQAPGSGGLGQQRQMPPAPNAPQQPGMSARSLFDDSALPDWLRQAGNGPDVGQQPTAYQPAAPRPAYGSPTPYGAPPAGPTYTPQGEYGGYPPYPQRGGPSNRLGQSPYPSTQANAFPSLDMAGAHQGQQPGGMPARGLVDSGALPGWLGGSGGQQPASSGSGVSGANGLAARSLIDETSLPQWLRAQPVAAQPVAQPYGVPAAPAAPWGAPATADEPLPTWLNQVYMDANVPRVEPARAQSDLLSPRQASGPLPGYGAEGRLPASAFVDESALPEWLKSQGGIPAQPAGFAPQALDANYGQPAQAQQPRAFDAYTPGSGASGRLGVDAQEKFSVSDLIDPEALPSWVGGQNTGSVGAWPSGQSPAPSAPSASSRVAPTTTGSYEAAAGESGGSWDEPNLPSWMRDLGGDGAGSQDESYQAQRPHSDYSGELTRGSRQRQQQQPGAASSSSWRRGQPIPSDELPPWLRSPRDDEGRPQPRGNGPHQASRQPMAQQDWWPEESSPSAQWTDWDEDNFGSEFDAGAEYGDSGVELDEPQGKQRGGWRRLFGRR